MAMVVRTLVKRGVTSCNTVLNFRPTPFGIAVHKAMKISILSQVVTTGIADQDPSAGMVGAGILRGREKCSKDGFSSQQKMWRATIELPKSKKRKGTKP